MNKPTKTELRSFYKNMRNSISQEMRKTKSNKIIDFALKYFRENKKCKTFFVYQSFASEVETGEYIETLTKSAIKVLIPHCDTKTETMSATVYNSLKKQTKNIYGIKECDCPEFTDEKIDVIIVPGIAFDKFGNRIGFGKGYYDKFINGRSDKPILVGFCFDEQIYDGVIPTDEYDVKMDIIITDKDIYVIGE